MLNYVTKLYRQSNRKTPLALAFAASATLLLATSGCASHKSKADERAAFMAGQQDVLMRLMASREQSVSVAGPVRNPIVPWTEDLTLARAIAAAVYSSPFDPHEIIIVRNGQAIVVDPKKLLAGDDVPLQAGDLIQIH